ncbi:MAG: hypothetical protein JXB29_01335 [Sedimentisphaerales bacterium]|nr:hypothetical protein [Sedimentisphaerales bacterium]
MKISDVEGVNPTRSVKYIRANPSAISWRKKLSFPAGLGAVLAILFIFGGTTAMNVALGISVKAVLAGYSYDVLIILIVMELFTKLIAQTGIMELLATKMAALSNGRKSQCILLFGGLMFLISCTLNNITAVMMVLPVIFVLLKAIDINQKYVSLFFAVILATSNLGGAASPIGDFPAIIILSSGITSFLSYLTHAFPLFLTTTVVICLFWSRFVKEDTVKTLHSRQLAVSVLQSQYRNVVVRWDVLYPMSIIFLCMFITWSVVPQRVLPPEMIAVLGYVVAAVVCTIKKLPVKQHMDMKSVLQIASFLYLAASVSQTGLLVQLANYLQNTLTDPKLLLLTIMFVTSLCAGLVSAGPAAAAIMPVIIQLSNGAFAAYSDWIAIAYAASICAGSSLFMWSATAGFILSEKVNNAQLTFENDKHLEWSVMEYLRYGIVNYLIQMSIAIVWILVSCR